MNIEDMSNERLLMTLEMSGWIERHTIASTIELLIEVERRRLDLELSYSSMFDFCIRHLGFSDNEAFRRLACARLVAKFPAILEPLRAGQVRLTNVVLLRDFFTAENVDALIAEISGKTKKEVELLVARLQPKPDIPDSIRALTTQPALLAPAAGAVDVPTPQTQRVLEKAAASTRPLSEDRYAISFTATAAFLEKLELVRALMHQLPKGHGLAEILERALDLLLAELEKAKLAKTARPRKAKASKDPGYISAETRRAVVERDEMQCTFTSADGVRCTARDRLELDHRQPRARGGAGDASNVRLLCSAHNRYEAEKAFGREHIERSIRTAQAKRRPTAATTRGRVADEVTPPATNGTAAESSAALEAPAAVVLVDALSEGMEPVGAGADDPDDGGKWTKLRYALVQDLGFRSVDADRRVAAMMTDPATRSRPLASLVVEALRSLSDKAGERSGSPPRR